PFTASEFFAEKDARYQAEIRTLAIDGLTETEMRQWLAQTADDIRTDLRALVADELLLAEFESSLKPEERLGLLAWVRDLRETLIRETRGSAALADQRFREEGGRSLDEQVKHLRDQELIKYQLQKAVSSRINISWRDIEQEYQRRWDEFNPPPVARFRMIWIAADNVEALEAVQSQLAAGVPFAEIASEHSAFMASSGGLIEISLPSHDHRTTRLFNQDPLNDAAQSLSVGETSPRIEFGERYAWIFLEAIVDNTVTLEEVQLELFDQVHLSRFDEERAKLFQKLITRGSLTDIREMERKLIEFAAERYLIIGEKSARASSSR
ncbi:MAG: hypothetical protein VYC34_11200, partial [Planctomycetota bacterium]|nr:hypothetical protein [Planctomycetota bacterium]